jgi:hypothetical protein
VQSQSSASGMLLLEAALAGVPATFLLAVYGQWAVLVAFGEWGDSKLFAVAVMALALGGAVALWQYWILAIRTAKAILHPIGPVFWLSVAAAAVTSVFLLAVAWPLGLAAVLPGFAAWHFMRIQRALSSSSPQSSVA